MAISFSPLSSWTRERTLFRKLFVKRATRISLSQTGYSSSLNNLSLRQLISNVHIGTRLDALREQRGPDHGSVSTSMPTPFNRRNSLSSDCRIHHICMSEPPGLSGEKLEPLSPAAIRDRPTDARRSRGRLLRFFLYPDPAQAGEGRSSLPKLSPSRCWVSGHASPRG